MLGQYTPHHWREGCEGFTGIIAIEGDLVVPGGEFDGALIVEAASVLLALVLVDAELLAVEIGLENAVLGQHPMVGLTDERAQDCGDYLTMVERGQRLADVVQ